MYKYFMKSKIHMAAVTDVRQDRYSGVAVDAHILEEAGIEENEKVQILNLNNGTRFEVCAKKFRRGSRKVFLNGVMSHHGQVHDRIVIIGYGLYTEEEFKKYRPRKIVLNQNNKIVARK